MLSIILRKHGKELLVPGGRNIEIPVNLHNPMVSMVSYDDQDIWAAYPEELTHITIEMYGTLADAVETKNFIECSAPAPTDLPSYRPPAWPARRPASGRALLALAALLVLATLAIGVSL